mmetsp:Transcript_20705/g.65292  ORF Transcript_20705/g.65292 Transcript_20705/m.65292 type:complete len:279 (+) Transcript_20705:843-1679(+)
MSWGQNCALDWRTAMSRTPRSRCRCTSAAGLQSSAPAWSRRLSTKSPWPRSRKRLSARQCSPSAKRPMSSATRRWFVCRAARSTRGASSASSASGQAHAAAAAAPCSSGQAPRSSPRPCPGQQRRMKFTLLPVTRILRASSSARKRGTISTSREYMRVQSSSRGTEASAQTKNSPKGSRSSPSAIHARTMASKGASTRRSTSAQASHVAGSPVLPRPCTAEAKAPPRSGAQASWSRTRSRRRSSGARSQAQRRRRLSLRSPDAQPAAAPAMSSASSRR